MATLTYSPFGNPGRNYPRACYNIRSKGSYEFPSFLFLKSVTVVMRASANRVAAARGGWWRHAFRGGFFDFIYVIIEVIGTCMQNFKKIDLKKNSTFFNQSCSALFLLQTVHLKKILRSHF